ncbi:MAG: hypothetical protein ACOCQG_00215 [Candidatus Nanoarchaeia archaeon]
MNKTNATIEAVNESFPIISGFLESLVGFFELLKWFAGGLFGLYLIFIFLKWYEFRKIRQILGELLTKVQSLDKRVEKIEKTVNKNKK